MKYLITAWIQDSTQARTCAEAITLSEILPADAHISVCLLSLDSISPLTHWGFADHVYQEIFPFIHPMFMAEVLAKSVKEHEYDGVFILSGTLCPDITVLLAKELNYSYCVQAQSIKAKQDGFTCNRGAYNYNVDAQVSLPSRGFVIGLERLRPTDSTAQSLQHLSTRLHGESHSHIVKQTLISKAENSPEKSILVVAGRGVGSNESVAELRTLCKDYGFGFGVTRPVAMNGWAGLSEIVGISGGIFSPRLCVVIGASGSAAFYAGIANSEYIVTVNIDKRAALLTKSDAYIIDDYKNVAKDILSTLHSRGGIL